MDGSRRSSHGNAYFTGVGKSKRIVMFDTLLETLTEEQSIAVLAHEMGHQKLNHIKKSLVLSLVTTFIGFWLLSLLVGYEPLYIAFGFERVSSHALLLIFAIGSGPIFYYLSPLFSGMSRRFEYQADRFAVDAVGGFQALRDALVALSKRSLSNLTPHPLYSFFHYSHPTLVERIAAMERYGQRADNTI